MIVKFAYKKDAVMMGFKKGDDHIFKLVDRVAKIDGKSIFVNYITVHNDVINIEGFFIENGKQEYSRISIILNIVQ